MQQPEFELLEIKKTSATDLPKTVYIFNKVWRIEIYTYQYKGKTQYDIYVGNRNETDEKVQL